MRDASAYYVGDTRLVSVTEALRIAGLRSFAHVPPDVLAKASARGTAVHEFLELLDLGLVEPDDAPSEINGYVNAYQAFRSDAMWQPEHIEEAVRSEIHGFAGTLDRTGTLKGGPLVLLDLKCVASLDDATGLQLAGYEIALREDDATLARQPLARYALQLRHDGTYRLQRYESRQDTHDFLAAVRIARWRLDRGLATLEEWKK